MDEEVTVPVGEGLHFVESLLGVTALQSLVAVEDSLLESSCFFGICCFDESLFDECEDAVVEFCSGTVHADPLGFVCGVLWALLSQDARRLEPYSPRKFR